MKLSRLNSPLARDPLADREPAVHDEVVPGHVLGLVGRQVDGRPRHVLRLQPLAPKLAHARLHQPPQLLLAGCILAIEPISSGIEMACGEIAFTRTPENASSS